MQTKLSFLLLALAASSCSMLTSDDKAVGSYATTMTFDQQDGGLPNGMRVGTTNEHAGGAHATWSIVADGTAPSAPNVLMLSDAKGHRGQTFNLLWNEKVAVADLDLTVRVRADGGVEDQGGGPAWRIAGPYDYYCARWNPLEDNFRVYSVRGGERLQLDTAKVRLDPGAWHTLRIRHVGDTITCWLNGEELLHAVDTKLMEAGGVGLWTKADAVTSFDDFGFTPR